MVSNCEARWRKSSTLGSPCWMVKYCTTTTAPASTRRITPRKSIKMKPRTMQPMVLPLDLRGGLGGFWRADCAGREGAPACRADLPPGGTYAEGETWVAPISTASTCCGSASRRTPGGGGGTACACGMGCAWVGRRWGGVCSRGTCAWVTAAGWAGVSTGGSSGSPVSSSPYQPPVWSGSPVG